MTRAALLIAVGLVGTVASSLLVSGMAIGNVHGLLAAALASLAVWCADALAGSFEFAFVSRWLGGGP